MKFFIYRLITQEIYPIGGYDQTFWVDRDNAASSIVISMYYEFRAEVFCPMELERFPFDNQTCYFEVLPIENLLLRYITYYFSVLTTYTDS